MKLTVSVLAAGLLCGVMLCGCYVEEEEPMVAAEPNQLTEVPVVDLYRDLAIQNAVISQRTVYPYHFINNSATLNALGQRDMAVLANHFAQNPGELTVRRDDASPELYKQRIETVLARLAENGVDRSRVRINDAMAGGDGMRTNEVIEVLARSRDPLTKTGDSGGYGTGMITQ